MALTIADTINVPTQLGEYQIQLCYGDITQVEEKMDMVMVSAFPGDYSAVGGTFIGALKRSLGIDVGRLARDKFMDLRTYFSCWISKELDSKVPFKRLLCFERSRAKGDLISQMRDMFRAFVPACGSQETSVITPLLGTGNQGYSESLVLKCMVEASASWMRAGLPLKCIKLVIYGEEDEELNEIFSSLKAKLSKKFQKKSHEGEEITYDVFIMYEEQDKEWMTKICNVLLAKDKDLKIYKELKKFDKEKIWQGQIFKVMACCKKIVAVLTPSYVGNKDCLDQFNMAMCCNRLRNSELLFPFLLVTVDTMPVYMKLVQYFDCRVRKEGDVLDIKVDQACSFLINPSSAKLDKDAITDPKERYDYDVFISYSHRKPTQAQDLLQILSAGNSDLKIFFDRSELTMGSLWQSSLYESLDRSECIIALVCPSYFSSTVCQEEYSIALARYLQNPSEVLFIQVLIEPMETVPSQFGRIPMIDCTTSEKFEKSVHKLAKDVIEWRYSRGSIPYVHKPVDKFSLKHVEKERSAYIKKNYSVSRKSNTLEAMYKVSKLSEPSGKQVDVAISFARDAAAFAGTLNCELCSKKDEKINVSFLSENMHGSLQDLDTAKQIVIIISKEFVQSHHHMQELHVALCRQRESRDRIVVRIIAAPGIPDKPMFLHLLPYETNMSDKIWTIFEGESLRAVSKAVMSYKDGMKGSFMVAYSNYYALQKTAHEVRKALSRCGSSEEHVPPIICNLLEAKLRANNYPQNTIVSEILIDISLDKNEDKPMHFTPLEEIKEKEPAVIQEGSTKPKQVNSDVVAKTQTVVKWADQDNSGTTDVKNKEGEYEGENNQLVKKAMDEMRIMEELRALEEEESKKKSKTCSLL